MDPLTPRDVFLAKELAADAAARFIEGYGPRDGAAADQNLQQLADDLPTRLALGDLAPTLFDILSTTPDPDAALVGFCRYVGTRTPKAGFIRELAADPRLLDILMQILGTSPFLSEILIRNPEYLYWLRQRLEAAPPDRIDYDTELDRLVDNAQTVEQQVNVLKRFQRREMLGVAARDLFGMLNRDSLTTTTTQLSNLADTIVDRTLRVAAAEAAARQGPIPGRFAVIGMGKLGGADLNYSSDIDLIYVYDASAAEAGAAHGRYQKLGRRLTGLLSDHTGEGYLYRVDMRLRPMGQGGNLVYSLKQSAQYYESLGETFERFALLKARPIAGDLELGRRFVDMVTPFVYRKYLDHAAIEELARYKARADREHARHGDLDVNIKEGRGGIREVELFAQVFQLIYGGEKPALRTGHTLTALDQLGAHDFIEPEVRQDLSTAYIFLRNIEHGLQAAQGQQTHSLSASARGLRALARRLGFDEIETLTGVLDRHRDRVHTVYANLFHGETGEEGLAGREVFRLLAGEIDDEQGRARLAEAGVENPDGALQAIRALDAAPSQGRSSSRNLLANLLASILASEAPLCARGQVLIRLEKVVARAGAPAALYRTLLEDDELRRRLLIGLDAGDLFAARLAAYPELLDFLTAVDLDRDAFRTAVIAAFDEVIANGDDLPSRFDPFRRIKAIEEFKVLAEWLTGRRLSLLNDKLSLVADCAIEAAARAVARDLPPTPDATDPDGGLDRLRPRQARQPRADRALGSRSGVRLRRRDDRFRPVPGPPEVRAGHLRPALEDDRGRLGVRDRHAAAPRGQDGSSRHSLPGLPALPARTRGDLGAHGLDPLPPRGRRCDARRPGPRDRRRLRLRALGGRHSRLRPARPLPHRARARPRGGRRPPGPEAGPRRARRHRLPAAGPATPRRAGAQRVPRRRHPLAAGDAARDRFPPPRGG